MTAVKQKDAHIWERDEYDWYVEPFECSLALISELQITGRIWDPAVGSGRILHSASQLGCTTVGSDVVKRSELCDFTSDFLAITECPEYDHIVSNPPFGVAEDFVRKAIEILTEGQTASMLLPLVWMAGFSKKRDWLPTSPLAHIMPMSPRPSMPPGRVIQQGQKPGNGTKDFAWFVWRKGYQGDPSIRFLNTSPYKNFNAHTQKQQMVLAI